MKHYMRADISFTMLLLNNLEWAIKPYELFNKVKEYIEKEENNDSVEPLYVFYDPITKSHMEIQKNVKYKQNSVDDTETQILHKIVVHDAWYDEDIYESWFVSTNFEDKFCKDINTFNDNFNDALIDYYACIQNQPNLTDSNEKPKLFIDKLGLSDKEYFGYNNTYEFLSYSSVILITVFG